jgi:hypothetical protein
MRALHQGGWPETQPLSWLRQLSTRKSRVNPRANTIQAQSRVKNPRATEENKRSPHGQGDAKTRKTRAWRIISRRIKAVEPSNWRCQENTRGGTSIMRECEVEQVRGGREI